MYDLDALAGFGFSCDLYILLDLVASNFNIEVVITHLPRSLQESSHSLHHSQLT